MGDIQYYNFSISDPYPDLDENLYILLHQLKALSISRQHLLKA